MAEKSTATDALISIVVPIYNVEEYLPNCLDSILAQTYANIEVLLVNDGSPDNAGAICDEYALRDERIKVFHIPNGGVAKARQLGVKNSTGEYIVFVDPDDWLPLNSVENLHNSVSPNVDIVIGAHSRFYNNGTVMPVKYTNQTFAGHEYLKLLLQRKIEIGPWSKLYSRKVFNADSFPNTKRGQDYLMNIDIACRVNSVNVINDQSYCYRGASATSCGKSAMLDFNYYTSFCYKINDILKHNQVYDANKKEYAISVLHVVFANIKRGVVIDFKSPLILDMLAELKNVRLDKSQTIMYMSIRSSFIRRTVRIAYNLVTNNNLWKLRQYINKLFNV